MEYKAVAKNIKMSPRKVRLVADALRGLSVDGAIKKLNFVNKRASRPLKKTIESVVANAVNNENAKKEGLKFKEIKVDEGITYKRYRFASRGRIAPYLRRTSHITVVLEDKIAKIEKKVEEKKTAVKASKSNENKKVTKSVDTKKGGGEKK